MIFNSFIFWGFFAVVIALYWVLPHRAQNRLLIVAGYIFYGCLGLALPRPAGVLDRGRLLRRPAPGDRLADPRRSASRSSRSRSSSTSACSGSSSTSTSSSTGRRRCSSSFGLEAHLARCSILLPVGISFYTFQSHELHDRRLPRRIQAGADRLETSRLFVAFFPQLVAGPIERAAHLLPQLDAAAPLPAGRLRRRR